jgi:uncharacterized repeat protein (TIGR03803 family)
MSKFNLGMKACGIFLLCATAAIALPAQTTVAFSPAQTFTRLHTFHGADGSNSQAALVQASNGDLYGTTALGGKNNCSYGCGTIFKITPSGMLTTVHNFHGTDGAHPEAGLVQGIDGDLYGTTEDGGSGGHGTIFKITPSGALTTIYRFCLTGDCTDGAHPAAGLIPDTKGDSYGTTYNGGAGGKGTIFRLTASGDLTTLYRFCMQSHCEDGRNPSAGLAMDKNGNVYGTTQYGGTHEQGTVFKITAGGILTTLHSFDGTDGDTPLGVVLASDGTLYGTTQSGGANTFYGSVFKITRSGSLTTLYSFCSQSGCADGDTLFAGLIQGSDENFYGTTFQGGINHNGTIFQITPSGALTVLYNFCSQKGCADGSQPLAGLVQGINGKFYGTTGYGGKGNACTYGCGTVFSLSVGLR